MISATRYVVLSSHDICHLLSHIREEIVISYRIGYIVGLLRYRSKKARFSLITLKTLQLIKQVTNSFVSIIAVLV